MRLLLRCTVIACLLLSLSACNSMSSSIQEPPDWDLPISDTPMISPSPSPAPSPTPLAATSPDEENPGGPYAFEVIAKSVINWYSPSGIIVLDSLPEKLKWIDDFDNVSCLNFSNSMSVVFFPDIATDELEKMIGQNFNDPVYRLVDSQHGVKHDGTLLFLADAETKLSEIHGIWIKAYTAELGSWLREGYHAGNMTFVDPQFD